MLRKRKQPTPSFQAACAFSADHGGKGALARQGRLPLRGDDAGGGGRHGAGLRSLPWVRRADRTLHRLRPRRSGQRRQAGHPRGQAVRQAVRGGLFSIAQIFPAILPLQTANPSPVDVEWRVGQNPGVSETTPGHPADLDEKVDFLKDTNDKLHQLDAAGRRGNVLGRVLSGRGSSGLRGRVHRQADGLGRTTTATSRTPTTRQRTTRSIGGTGRRIPTLGRGGCSSSARDTAAVGTSTCTKSCRWTAKPTIACEKPKWQRARRR